MKIEQALLDRFISVRTPELTAEQVTSFFDNLTLADVTVSSAVYDGSNALLRRGSFNSTNRKWRARNVTWTASSLSSLVADGFAFEGTVEEFMTNTTNGKFYAAPDSDKAALGCVVVPHTEGTVYDLATAKLLFSSLTGYDFSDLGELLDPFGEACHVVNIITDTTQLNDKAFNVVLRDRIHAVIEITGPVVYGKLYLVTDGYYSFGEDVDIGTVPGALA